MIALVSGAAVALGGAYLYGEARERLDRAAAFMRDPQRAKGLELFSLGVVALGFVLMALGIGEIEAAA